MKSSMRNFALFVSVALSSLSFAQTNEACELVAMQNIVINDVLTDTIVPSFHEAKDFIDSVYDDVEGHLKHVDGHAIRGVMCQRETVVPTLRDFEILKTGIPLSISNSFDQEGVSQLSLYYTEGRFRYEHSGWDLSEEEIVELLDIMLIFNFQPHDLPKP